jgi:phage pi2 protein 07
MKKTNFEYSIASDVDYEDLIADIGFNNNLVAILSQEEGFENMKITIYPPQNSEYWNFQLDEFQDVIQKAKNRLFELKKTIENSKE